MHAIRLGFLSMSRRWALHATVVRAIVAVAAALAVATPVAATTAPPNLCVAGKVKCVNALATAVLKCLAAASAKPPTTAGAAKAEACVRKAEARFGVGAAGKPGCFAKVEAKQNPAKPQTVCPDGGRDAETLDGLVDELAAALAAQVAPDGSRAAGSSCDGGKLQCLSKTLKATLRCHGDRFKKGGATDPACLAKALDVVAVVPSMGCFGKLESKQNPAKPKSVCGATGQASAARATLLAFVDDALDAITPPPLDCEAQGYPCTWTTVPPSVIEQSGALADAASAILEGGGTTAQAAAGIAAAGPAELDYDDDKVRFRLAGGRPIWVARQGTLGPTGDDAAGEAPVVTAASRAARASRAASFVEPTSSARSFAPGARRGAGGVVLSEGQQPKSALVVAPYAWAAGYPSAEVVTGELNVIPDYAGHVTTVSNDTKESGNVTVAHFAAFKGHEVVYVQTHGGVMCTRVDAPKTCHILLEAQVAADYQSAVAQATHVGVELVKDGADWTLNVGKDFIRHYYPGGLEDSLIIVEAGSSYYNNGLARLFEGRRSNFVGWQGPFGFGVTQTVLLPILEGLAKGRSFLDGYAALPNGAQDPQGGSMIAGRQDVRIRDVVRAFDSTGDPLVDDLLIGIDGYTEDGHPDNLQLGVDIVGFSEEEAQTTIVRVVVNGTEYVHEPIASFATVDGDQRWTSDVVVALGFDVAENQPLDIWVTVDLPEGGVATHHSRPRATAPHFVLGRVWEGTFVTTGNVGTVLYRIEATARFERDPNENPMTKHPTFNLVQGSMTWSLTDGAGGCDRSAPTTTTPLPASTQAYLEFDLTTDPIQYSGFGSFQGPTVDITISCPDQDPIKSPTHAGGVWFVAPEDEHYDTGGATLHGTYNSGLASNQWTISRVE